MIAVCSNPYRDLDLKIANKVVDLLSQNNYFATIFKIFTDEDDAVRKNAGSINFAIVIGGDGTILKVANELTGFEIPILGINLGTMGFMATLEPDEIDIIPDLIKNGYKKSKRMMLDVALYRDNACIYHGMCLNDAVIHGYGDVISIKSYNSGKLISSFDGDGIILSTPTGSTGYAMSAGGPIVEPEARAIILAPICAHSLSARTMLLSHDRVIEVITQRLRDRKAYLSVDGNFVTNILNNDKLIIKESVDYTVIASSDDYSFFGNTYDKLS